MNEMKKPHITLRLALNLAAMAVFGTCAAVAACLCNPPPYLAIATSLVLGLACGLMQNAAINKRPGAFAQARSMRQVRRHLAYTTWGKRSIWLLWVSYGLIVLLSVFLYYSILVAVVGYFCIMMARELATIRTIWVLTRTSK